VVLIGLGPNDELHPVLARPRDGSGAGTPQELVQKREEIALAERYDRY